MNRKHALYGNLELGDISLSELPRLGGSNEQAPMMHLKKQDEMNPFYRTTADEVMISRIHEKIAHSLIVVTVVFISNCRHFKAFLIPEKLQNVNNLLSLQFLFSC